MEVPFESVDILSNEMLRSGMKEYSQWPTFPQVYIGGEFFGGCDILLGAAPSLCLLILANLPEQAQEETAVLQSILAPAALLQATFGNRVPVFASALHNKSMNESRWCLGVQKHTKMDH
jgi:Glutaredoxin